jgi:hypothetical protein
MQDELSSTETTPPPMSDAAVSMPSHHKRFSSSSAGFSRSYRSIPSSSFAESLASPGLPPQRFPSGDHRPTTSGTDDGGLAAAAELLNFGTPRTRPTQMSPDVPPVPPLPEQYQAANRLSGMGTHSTPTVFNPLGMHPITQPVSDERDVKMQEDDLTPQGNFHGSVNMDDDEDGMFRMEAWLAAWKPRLIQFRFPSSPFFLALLCLYPSSKLPFCAFFFPVSADPDLIEHRWAGWKTEVFYIHKHALGFLVGEVKAI